MAAPVGIAIITYGVNTQSGQALQKLMKESGRIKWASTTDLYTALRHREDGYTVSHGETGSTGSPRTVQAVVAHENFVDTMCSATVGLWCGNLSCFQLVQCGQGYHR